MADRVKYFLLGVLFLVVAGVIAYDKWNSAGEPPRTDLAEENTDTVGTFEIGPVVHPDPLEVPPAPPQEQAKPKDLSGPVQPPTPAPVKLEQTPPPRVERKPELPPAPVPVPDKTHVVRKGETLEAISIKYYGSRDGVELIADANSLGNRNRIFEKQKLIIPARKEIAKEGGSGGTTKAPVKSSGKIPSRYTVKASDGDLYAICRRFYGSNGVAARVHDVMKVNHLYSRDVKAGTVLMLPAR